MLIGVTGGSGKVGRRVLAGLVSAGHDVRSIDVGREYSDEILYHRADLRELWQTVDALKGLDAVVHLAGMGVPGASSYPLLAEQSVFAANTISTYNVFLATVSLGIRRVVWASSETVMGFPFEQHPPDFAPLTEEHPMRPEYSYALAKATAEQLAEHATRRSGHTIVGLRFSVVFDERDYHQLPRFWEDPRLARWNLWSYVDIRDVVDSCRVAVEAPIDGSENFIIAAPDTLMDRPTKELLDQHAPDVHLSSSLSEFQSLQSTEKARDLLGYQPHRSWRKHTGS
jgi:nucleoside-diphosphate-sugar epimerase